MILDRKHNYRNVCVQVLINRFFASVFTCVLCFCVDQLYVFYVYLLIRSTFSTTCVSVSTLVSVFWCLHVGQTFKSIICVSVFTFQMCTCFGVYLLVRLRRAVFSFSIIINWHQEVDAAEGCWGKS